MEGDRRTLAHPEETARARSASLRDQLSGLPTGPTRRPISRPPARRRPPAGDPAGGTVKGGRSVATDEVDDDWFAWPTDLIGAEEIEGLLQRTAPVKEDPRAKVRAALASGSTMPFDVAFADAAERTSDAEGIVDLVKDSLGPPLAEAAERPGGLALELDEDGNWVIPEEKRHRPTVVFHDRAGHQTSTLERAALVAITALSTWFATRSGAEPTGIGWLDVAWCAALVGLMVLSAAHARRWVLVVAAALVCMGGAGACLVAGGIALVGTAAMVLRDSRNRVLGGLVGAAIAVGALQFPTSGSSAWLVAVPVVACLLVLRAGYANATDRTRTWARRAMVAGGAAVAAMVVLSVVMLLVARSQVAKGLRETQAAADAAATGDQGEAAVRLAAASSAFDSAHGRMALPLAAPIQVVPVLGQNYRAIRDAAGEGAQVTGALGAEVTTLDYDQLNRPEGGIDTGVLRSYRTPVRRLDEELRSSIASLDDIRSTWLVPPVRNRVVDLRGRLRSYQRDTALARLAVDRGPAILGADGTRRYLILLGNPAESRDLGGHLGNWAELTVTDGKLHLEEVGSPLDLALPVDAETAKLIEGYPPSLVDMEPRRFPQNWALTRTSRRWRSCPPRSSRSARVAASTASPTPTPRRSPPSWGSPAPRRWSAPTRPSGSRTRARRAS